MNPAKITLLVFLAASIAFHVVAAQVVFNPPPPMNYRADKLIVKYKTLPGAAPAPSPLPANNNDNNSIHSLLFTEAPLTTTSDSGSPTIASSTSPKPDPSTSSSSTTAAAPSPSPSSSIIVEQPNTPDFETNLGDTTRLVTIQPGIDIEDAIQQLNQDPNIEFVQKDTRIPPLMVPNDPKYWPYGEPSTQWQHIAIKSEFLWNVTTGPPTYKPVKICIPDSGLMKGHPDFMYTNTNGKPLIQGWSVIPLNSTYDASGNYINPIPKPGSKDFYDYHDRDAHGHGTLVAGLLAAVGNNGEGMAGMVWKNLMIYTCRYQPNDGKGGYESDLVKCLDLCQQEGIKIYSCSSGGSYPRKIGTKYEPELLSLREKIQEISDAGGLYITGSANEDVDIDSSPENYRYPASYSKEIPGMLVVGGSRLVDSTTMEEAPKWAYGKTSVHLMSPAENLLTTWNQKNTFGDYYAGISGVSGAVPTVAGAVAMLKSVADSKKIDITLQQIKWLLIRTVDKNIVGGATKYKSGGRLNVGRAMQELLKMAEEDQTPSPTPTVPPLGPKPNTTPREKPTIKKKPITKKPTTKKPSTKKPTTKKKKSNKKRPSTKKSIKKKSKKRSLLL